MFLFILLFCRLCGFFLLSPFFAGKSISSLIRCGFALACSLLIAPPLIIKFDLPTLPYLLVLLYALKEIALGYLIGFIFSLVIEAAAFAGQLVGALMGFSATELLAPLSTSPHPLMARFFSLITFTLFLTLDLHHALLRLLYESFEAVPLQTNLFTHDTFVGILEASQLLFSQALEFALFPLLILLALLAVFALLSRFFPIFWIGFPLQLMIGLAAVGASVTFFSPILEHAFFRTLEIVKKCIAHY